MHQKKNRRNERKLKARKERSQSKQSEMAAGKIKLKISTESKVGGGGSGSGWGRGRWMAATRLPQLTLLINKQTADRTMAKMLITASEGNQPPKQQKKCTAKNKIHLKPISSDEKLNISQLNVIIL